MICSRNFGGRLFRSASVASATEGCGCPSASRLAPDEVDEGPDAVLGSAGEAHAGHSGPGTSYAAGWGFHAAAGHAMSNIRAKPPPIRGRLAVDDRRPLADPRAGPRSTTRIASSRARSGPRTLDEYIGQREVKANLSVLLARRRAGERPPTTSSSTARPVSARRPSRRSSPASSGSTSATRAGRRSSGPATSPRS